MLTRLLIDPGASVSQVPPRTYRLIVAGELGSSAGRAFEGMTLAHDHGNTVLVGPVRDQAALFGILQRVCDLGLTLLSAAAVDDEEVE